MRTVFSFSLLRFRVQGLRGGCLQMFQTSWPTYLHLPNMDFIGTLQKSRFWQVN